MKLVYLLRVWSGFIILTLTSSLCLANGYHFLHQSAEGTGTSYATNGTAANDISSMFSNPSSIIRFDGTRLSGGFVIDRPRSKLKNATATAPFSNGTVPVSGFPEEPTQPLDTAYGAATYFSHEIKPGLVMGASITAPYAYESDYPDTAVSRYTATSTQLQAINFSPTLAYRINEKWAIGGSVNYQYYDTELGTMVATSITNPTIETDVESVIKGSDSGWGFSLGFEYQATEWTRLGVSYRSKIDHSFNGDISLNGSDENFNRLVALASAGGVNITSRSGGAKFDITTPSMLQFGLLHKLGPKLELYANANYFGWSDFRDTHVQYTNGLADTVVDNDWDDSWYVALGMGYQYSEKLKFRWGGAYDWTPTPADAVSPRAPNDDRWYLSLGFSYEPSKKWKIDFGYQYAKFKDVKIALRGGNNIPRGTLDADFELYANIFMTQLNYKF